MSVPTFSSPVADHVDVVGVDTVAAPLPCVYCRADIAAGEFVFWTAARRLLSATCPQCHRRVTLTAKTWRQWSRWSQARAI
jgi:hypothetical protein